MEAADAAAASAVSAMGTERKPSVASSKPADVRTEHEVWHAASQEPQVVTIQCLHPRRLFAHSQSLRHSSPKLP